MNNFQSFKQAMELTPKPKVKAMLKQFDIALEQRAIFEQSKKKPAYIELQAAFDQMEGNATLARFFCVLGADPVQFLNKERKKGYRTNLKVIRKIRMLAEYMRGDHGAINGVVKALFAATILAAKAGKPWVNNTDAELLLMSSAIKAGTQEMLSSAAQFFALNINSSEEARNQACQFRTAFENLGIFFKSREEEGDISLGGIYADMNNPLIKALASHWRL